MKEMNKIKKVKCQRCGHVWAPRIARRPEACPRCKRYDHDRPLKRVKALLESTKARG